MEALKNWRKRLPGGTLAAGAARLGVSAAQMSRYESGKRQVPPEKVTKYAKITKLSRSALRPDLWPPRRKRQSIEGGGDGA